ncbi:uncharacterized protein [Aristolochia californica]|uniref:uncharacterized protein isoform X2 n=1 Tax=Aristolochia californica TaxID=171875 RepID=UPI0035DB14BE
MEDIGLFRQGWKWLQSQKHLLLRTQTAARCFREKVASVIDRNWPMISSWCVKLAKFLCLLILQWRDCTVRGTGSLLRLGPAALLVVMWSCFLSLTSLSCLVYVLLILVSPCNGAAGSAVHYLGYTPGLFIAGLFGILLLWMYGNLWITGMLFMVGGYLFSLNHARLVILMATTYALYCVKVRVGWLGVSLSISLAFLSNDLLNCFLKGYEGGLESTDFEEHKESESIPEDFPEDSGYSSPASEPEKVSSCKSSSKTPGTSSFVNIQKAPSVGIRVERAEPVSLDEMRSILNSADHYEALGLPRHKNIDFLLLKKEYRRKAVLVHPDKNMGSPLASESFKKLQCAYEVLSDSEKKRDYDDQLRKEECRRVYQRPQGTSQQDKSDYRSEESRRIHCTKCGHSHIWICTNRSKAKARWCEDCFQYHPAKDGDGWVEIDCSAVFAASQKVKIPRAFVCAEGKIFDVSEWASCQGMSCRPNTHKPSFHVNMVGLEKSAQRSNPSRFPWDLDAEMTEDDEEDFDMWFQQALASGLFSETSSKRRKSWSPFKLHLYHRKYKRQWRRSP